MGLRGSPALRSPGTAGVGQLATRPAIHPCVAYVHHMPDQKYAVLDHAQKVDLCAHRLSWDVIPASCVKITLRFRGRLFHGKRLIVGGSARGSSLRTWRLGRISSRAQTELLLLDMRNTIVS